MEPPDPDNKYVLFHQFSIDCAYERVFPSTKYSPFSATLIKVVFTCAITEKVSLVGGQCSVWRKAASR